MREHHAQDEVPYFEGDTFEPGDLIVVGTDKIGHVVRVPADYATVPYVLGINPFTGLPAWRVVSGITFDEGFGTAFGGGFGEG